MDNDKEDAPIESRIATLETIALIQSVAIDNLFGRGIQGILSKKSMMASGIEAFIQENPDWLDESATKLALTHAESLREQANDRGRHHGE